MKPSDVEREKEQPLRPAGLIPPAGPRGRAGRDLPLVKWCAWMVMVVFVLLCLLVLWGLATHEPSQWPVDSGD